MRSRLLAIMLGRLEMTIDECFNRFYAYGKEIFSHPKPFSFLRFLTVKYSDERLIRGVRHIVGNFDPLPDSEKWRRTIFKDTSGRCKTLLNLLELIQDVFTDLEGAGASSLTQLLHGTGMDQDHQARLT